MFLLCSGFHDYMDVTYILLSVTDTDKCFASSGMLFYIGVRRASRLSWYLSTGVKEVSLHHTCEEHPGSGNSRCEDPECLEFCLIHGGNTLGSTELSLPDRYGHSLYFTLFSHDSKVFEEEIKKSH